MNAQIALKGGIVVAAEKKSEEHTRKRTWLDEPRKRPWLDEPTDVERENAGYLTNKNIARYMRVRAI